eukprot:EG_transcript_18816
MRRDPTFLVPVAGEPEAKSSLATASLAVLFLAIAGLGFVAGGPLAATTRLAQAPVPSVSRGLTGPGALVGRRGAMAGVAVALPAVLLPRPAEAAYGSAAGAGGRGSAAEPVEFEQFYGAADPPATYGGVGGTTRALARYGYKVNRAAWKEVAVGKVEKGIIGIDSLWEGPGKKRAFCITVIRAGEDNVGFSISSPPETIIRSLSGSDPNLQEALLSGTLTYSERSRNGVKFYDFDVDAVNHYLVSVGAKQGRLFAFIVTAPERVFQKDKEVLQQTFDSFEVY